MRIGLAQINPLVGDLSGNAAKVRQVLARASGEGADLLVFPELTICGYPPKDLVLKHGFVAEGLERVRELAADCRNVAALIGLPAPNESPEGRTLLNAVALCRAGRVERWFHKKLLPTYDVFDERRYFEPGRTPMTFELSAGGRNWRVGVTICEDLLGDEMAMGRRLYADSPIEDLAGQRCDLVVNLSASPFWRGKHRMRTELLGGLARRHGVRLAFVNQVGGNDELVFDGASMLLDAAGRLAALAGAFEEDLLVVDADAAPESRVKPYPADLDAVLGALVLGTRDYVNKCGFREVVLGLSGGIDSAVTAAIAVMALGGQRVHGVALPSRYSSAGSLADAESLAGNLGMHFEVIGIESIHGAFEKQLAGLFAGLPANETEENVQARIRGAIIMALSNKFGWLPLTTGNKSELAVGYCTLYGDMCGGLALLSDVPKTLVYQLAPRINTRLGGEVIPRSTVDKPPSAELKPDQTDQDTLPPYELLDRVLQLYVEEELTSVQVIERLRAEGPVDEDAVRRVVRMVDRNEYKRRQAAPGLKVTSRAFGFGRRMPIAARYL